MNYIGQKCGLCDEVFNNTSDVVVCPECGAPHHRECYVSAGHCAHSDKHAHDYTWSAEKSEQPGNGNKPVTDQGVICPVCGSINLYGSGFCSQCGTRLVNTASDSQTGEQQKPLYGSHSNGKTGEYFPGFRLLFGTGMNNESEFPYDQYSFDGIKGDYWKKYIGKSVPFYFSAFTIMDQTGRKASFSWAAGLFPYAYFAYRRVWWASLVAVIMNIVLAIPSTILALTEMGVSSVPMTETFLVYLSYAGTACSIINFAYRILSAIFGFWVYRKNASRKLVEALNKNKTFASGPSVWGLIIVLVLLFVINGVISMSFLDVSAYMKILGIGPV